MSHPTHYERSHQEDPFNFNTLLTEIRHQTFFITLNRPHARNAMSLEMVAELRTLFNTLANHPVNIRAIVIRGAEGHFCSGGDIKDMVSARANASNTTNPACNFVNDPYYQLNRAYGLLLKEVNTCSKVTIAVLEGSVMGGGMGIAAVADVVLSHHNAQLAMPETKIGVIPSQIIPFITAKIGERQIRKMALLGQKLTGHELLDYGLADHLFDTDTELQVLLDRYIEQAILCAPQAVAITKGLINRVTALSLDQLLDEGAQAFAQAIRSKEGVEGTMAFIQKRTPTWVSDDPQATTSQDTQKNHPSEVTHD